MEMLPLLFKLQICVFFIFLLPLIGALLNTFVFRKMNIKWVTSVATAFVFIPFLLSLYVFFNATILGLVVKISLFNWISVPYFKAYSVIIPFGLTVDRLTSIFLLIITGVGTLIHFYSGEYMSHEDRPYRFFVYLNLFIFSMLALVLGSNMLVTFLGWEGVGVCSYLLIGYWFNDHGNSKAAIKAFIANRVGDVGFLLAMFLCFNLFGTIDYANLATISTNLGPQFIAENITTITLIGLSLLLAVSGKSAQIPLYTWLPDAMAGPTPVSALIHAATMVTAGIYLMTRCCGLLVLSPVTMYSIAIIGAATALFSATIGLAQTDIKKVLAYSTCSQLGYMVMACGVGAFQYGVAHVMTHAFFKACLFLGAGSVIHAMHHEQDIRKMGGLFKKMPITSMTFILATLAIIGFPGFSGFFSKDAILLNAWTGPFGHPIFWVVGVLTAALTSFYMLRLTILVFFSPSRAEDPSHIHETNIVITLPLIILAILSTLGGLIAIPEFMTGTKDVISGFLSPVTSSAYKHMASLGYASHHASLSFELILMGVATGVVFLSGILAIVLYKNGLSKEENFAQKFSKLYQLVQDKWRVDELYDCIIVKPLSKLGSLFYKYIDRAFLEGVVNGLPKSFYFSTTVLSDVQSGIVRSYLKLMFVVFLVICCLIFI